ncbi:MAG: protein-L-isoaspartate O-methyltransferase [Gammaproteobacteria bacterium]|nr:protein-L-isoaspartate O-methyltransferase [Gammaproteobacteria bacterium]
MNIEQARFNMVEQQVRPWEVLDQAVLDAMMTIPRERFVPDEFKRVAFSDTRIPLAHGQAMLAPKWEGRILQALAPTKRHRALVIGTGSGYLTALCSHLAREVVSVDLYEDFITKANRKFRANGLKNIDLQVGDGCDGWPTAGSFDVIAVTASAPQRRDAIERQLSVGGRLFIVIGSAPAMEALVLTRSTLDVLESESLFELELEPLVGAEAKPQFEF